jgi:hypothetical protein
MAAPETSSLLAKIIGPSAAREVAQQIEETAVALSTTVGDSNTIAVQDLTPGGIEPSVGDKIVDGAGTHAQIAEIVEGGLGVLTLTIPAPTSVDLSDYLKYFTAANDWSVETVLPSSVTDMDDVDIEQAFLRLLSPMGRTRIIQAAFRRRMTMIFSSRAG